MKTPIAILSLLLIFSPAHAGESAANTVRWQPKIAKGDATFGWTGQNGVQGILAITNASGAAAIIHLATLTNPDIHSKHYGVAGQIRYDEVSGEGYLEMWNHFPAKDKDQAAAYFSRTLAGVGLMKKISGNSDWREFRLPFNNSSGIDPKRLEINLHLPGNGTVYLKTATLHNYPSPGAMMSSAGAWWTANLSGWIGGGVGTIFGLWGGLLGLLAQSGKGRAFVTASVLFNIIIGAISLLVGIVALTTGQPYHIWYPFILIGLLLPIIMLSTRGNLLRQYTAAEERRMNAIDAVTR